MGKKGMRAESVVKEPEVSTVEDVGYPMYVCNCRSVRVRKLPSIDSAIVTVIPVGETVNVDVTFNHEDFAKVKTKNEVEGYIMHLFLTKQPPDGR